jgi:hypothetical protein
VVISVEAGHVDNTIHPEYFTSKVSHAEPQMGSTDRNIPIKHNCTNEELHFGMLGGSMWSTNNCDESAVHVAIPTASRPRRGAAAMLERFDLATLDGDVFEAWAGDNTDADDEVDALQVND